MEEITPELVEQKLGLKLPTEVVRSIERCPQNNESFLACRTDLIPESDFRLCHTLASLLVENLFRKSPQYQQTLFGVSDRQLAIGVEENGDAFYVELDQEKLPVYTREHDGDGDPERISDSITGFYNSMIPCSDAPVVKPENPTHIFITRASAAWKSCLNPIELDEWSHVASDDPEIELTNYREFPNPFKKTIVRKDSPGMAKWKDHAIEYRDGALVCRFGEEILPKARSIAAAFDARVEDDFGNER